MQHFPHLFCEVFEVAQAEFLLLALLRRYFLRQIATRVVVVDDGDVVDYEGDYEYFLERNEEAAEKEVERARARREVEKANIKAKSKMR